jgi:hypothetical protein
MLPDQSGITDDRQRELSAMAAMWGAHVVGRGRVALLPPCADAEEELLRRLCREAICRESWRERQRRAAGDLPIARHGAAAAASPRERQLFRMAAGWAAEVAEHGGDIPLPITEPGEADQMRDLCIAACKRLADRDRGRRRAAQHARAGAGNGRPG